MTTVSERPIIPDGDATPLVKQLLDSIEALQKAFAKLNEEHQLLKEAHQLLKEENQLLKDEIAYLKGLKPRPKILPSMLEGSRSQGKGGNEGKGKPRLARGKSTRKKKKTILEIHQEQVIQPSQIPEKATFKGYKYYSVQDITFKPLNTRYKIARWQLPDGTYVSGNLPEGIHGHYGPELVTYILHQYYACRVTAPLLLKQLHERGVLISAGQLNNILISAKTDLHEEASELLMAGIQAQNQIQVDDTGARHRGKNQYTTVIGNEWFSVFVTAETKSRANFFRLLQNGEHACLINDDTVAYLEGLGASDYLPGYVCMHKGAKFTTQEAWEKFLKEINITGENEVRWVTEAALYANVIDRGIPRDLGVHGDDAGQFDVFVRSLCWIHEERHYRKIVPVNDQAREDLERVRNQIWTLYKELKHYQQMPNTAAVQGIKQQFDDIFLHQNTSSPTLTKRLRLTYSKKEELLRVLERPNTPLHNNSSETDARSAVTQRKVSGCTRSDDGRDARDTFLSLKQTCLKLGINFITFLRDRVKGLYEIPRLAVVIHQRSSITKAIE